MVAGDSSKRSETDDFAGRAVTHKCVGGSGADTKHLPNEPCDQIRVQVTVCLDKLTIASYLLTSYSSPLAGTARTSTQMITRLTFRILKTAIMMAADALLATLSI